MNKQELDKILEQHKLWLSGDGGGRANLRYANLDGANLRVADLRGAIIADGWMITRERVDEEE